MYDWPETHAALQAYWQSVRTNLKPLCPTLPMQLNHTSVDAQWQQSDLLLSQTCGYPLVTALPEELVVIGTLNYDVELMRDGRYASVFLIKNSDSRTDIGEFNGAAFAFNSTDSQSGYNSVRNHLLDSPSVNATGSAFFGTGICSGSHRESIKCVASGMADICALDPISWFLAKRHEKTSKAVKVLGQTGYTPALPLVSHPNCIPGGISIERWRDAVSTALLNAIDSNASKALLLSGISYIEKQQYAKVPIHSHDMIARTSAH